MHLDAGLSSQAPTKERVAPTLPDPSAVLGAATIGDVPGLVRSLSLKGALEETDAVSVMAFSVSHFTAVFLERAVACLCRQPQARHYTYATLVLPLQDGATAAILASSNGHLPCVRALVEAGADFTAATTVCRR